MKFLPSYYEALKREVSELTDQLVPVLSDDERRWIAEWISVGEYGLAVIAMLENLRSTADRVGPQATARVREVALRIGLEDEVREYLPPD